MIKKKKTLQTLDKRTLNCCFEAEAIQSVSLRRRELKLGVGSSRTLNPPWFCGFGLAVPAKIQRVELRLYRRTRTSSGEQIRAAAQFECRTCAC